jgi:hypothetical protein
MNILFNTLLRPMQRVNRGIEDEERVMWHRIIDIIIDRDLAAMGRLAMITALLAVLTVFAWLVLVR